MTSKYNLTIKAASRAEADQKAQALAKLAGAFSAKVLTALAGKGKRFIEHPVYGPMIRKELGL